MSDTIGIMRDGKVVQHGSPRQLYDAPVNRYVADFVGESNFFDGTVAALDGRDVALRTAAGVTLRARQSAGAAALAPGAGAVVAVRPEVIELWMPAERRDASSYDCALEGRIQNRIYLGDQTEFSIATAALGSLLVRAPKTAAVVAEGLGQGETVMLGWRRENALALADG